ncbi:MAG TPA: peptidoglycan-binding domain-containing protein [Chloroflexota bacterium]
MALAHQSPATATKRARRDQPSSARASNPLASLQRAAGNQAIQRLLQPEAGVITDLNTPAGGALMGFHREVGNQVAQRLVSPRAGVLNDLNTPAGGERDDAGLAQRFIGQRVPVGSAGMGWTTSSARAAAQPGSVLSQANGPMGGDRAAPPASTLQRKIGDGHDLKSARLKGDPVLEAVFDNERVLSNGSSGPAVIKLQHALTDLGIRMPQHGIDGLFGTETRGQVKTFQKSAGLTDDGVVGPKTMEALDTQLASGAGGPGPLPSPVPAPPGKAAPTLAAAINTGPAPGTNGQMNFVINWQLGGNAGPKGGFVIQDVLFVWKTRDAKGKDVPNPDPRTSPLRYFEAWQVAPKSTTLTPVTTDTFFWPGAAPWAGNNSKGRVTIAATAHYFDDVNALPKHMVANNAATFAGILQSSLADPALAASVSGPVAHSLAFHWDSTKTPNSPTVLDAHTP